MEKFLFNVLGTADYPYFFSTVFFSLLGVFISLLIHALHRDSLSPRTPVWFSWNFLFSDNLIRLIGSGLCSLLLIFVAIRFTKELLGLELNFFVALLIGFCSDKLAQKLKEVSDKINN